MRKFLFLLALVIAGRGGGREMGDFNTRILLDLHNEKHKPAFQVDLLLQEVAQDHAEWMAENRSLQHADLGGTDFDWRGENIGRGYPTEKSAFIGWWNSKGHKANIMNKHFTHIGFGCAKDKFGGRWWSVEFGGFTSPSNDRQSQDIP